ncbi:chemotaxis protein CheA [Brevundimonas sp.]|uniref:chemotaxis protein CheA n=1 Tax=Brevundimonas sp. TaxID=1871086 RepID=UPI0035B15239
MDELLAQFLIEAPELSAQASEDLLALEQTPDDAMRLDSAFRAVHTLKGSVGLFDFGPMHAALHAAEDSLDAVRGGKAEVTKARIGDLLAVLDAVDGWLAEIARDGALGEEAEAISAGLLARLTQAAPAARAAATALPLRTDAFASQHAGKLSGEAIAVRYTPSSEAYFSGDDPLAIALAAPEILAFEVAAPGAVAEDYDPFRCALVFDLICAAPVEAVRTAFRLVADQVEMSRITPEAPRAEPAQAARGLRIDAGRIDALANLVDELVVAKNGLSAVTAGDVASLISAQDQIARLTSALHGAVTRLRLTPLAPVFRRLQRAARDIAGGLGRDVQIRIEGQDIEVDKAVVEGLYEPLLHVVRNALDHGVEPAEDRLAAGKPGRATLTLSARAMGDRVLVEAADDGRGVDPARVAMAAMRRGLITEAQGGALTPAEALELLFQPGFSTAGQVSDLSGRGVGMDAVRTAVERLGGRATLASTPGQGTTAILSLPLTMVISQILIVACGSETFGAPLRSVGETARIHRRDVTPVRHRHAFVWREETLPLLWLSSLLRLPASETTDELTVLIVNDGGRKTGMVVDAVMGRMEGVLRPLSGLLAAAPGVVGTTLMGDGRVLMVLDLPELIG